MKDHNMLMFANHYYNFGFNVTHISTDRKDFHFPEENILKAPSHIWTDLLNRRQSLEELHSFNWDNACGIGTVLQFNNLRALDIDGCNDMNLIQNFLKALDLPEDYEWVVKSGSRNGFHIIFYAPEHLFDKEPNRTTAFSPNLHNESIFKHIELRWSGHLVLPPSVHMSYFNYCFTSNGFPTKKPLEIDINKLQWMVEGYCGQCTYHSVSLSFVFFVDTFEKNEEALFSNHSEQLIKPKFLFFDTETTGLPQKFNAPLSDLENWPRLVQIAWMVFDEEENLIKKKEYIIQPNGFLIPKTATEFHGISNEHALMNGESISLVLEEFLLDLKDVELVIGHNIEFDEKIVGAELLRLGTTEPFQGKSKICTMDSSKDYCSIKGAYGNKWPTLTELHYKLFEEDFENVHNATSDIEATAKCFWELKKLGVITVNDEYLPF